MHFVINLDHSHGRLAATPPLADCPAGPDGTDLSATLVAQGLALDWTRFSGGSCRHLEPDGARKKLWRVDAKHKGRLTMDTPQNRS